MKNVLIVEDSTSMRSFIVSALEGVDDFQVVETGNGFEALKALPRHRFDLILTDINMPDINGLELVSFIRSRAEYKTVPLFIITTEGTSRDQERGMALGADEYLVKPFRPEDLQRLVRSYLYGEDIQWDRNRQKSQKRP